MRDPVDAPAPGLPELVAVLLDAEPDLPTILADAMRARVPAYTGASTLPPDELIASCAAHVRFVAAATRTGARDAAVRAIGADRARRGIPLADVLSAVRVGSETLWLRLVSFAQSHGNESAADIGGLASDVWSVCGVFADLLAEGYRDEEELRIIQSQRERFALIETVLSGRDQPGSTLWYAIDSLGLPRDRPYVVAAIDIRGKPQSPAPDVDRPLRRAGMESVWLLRTDVELGIISSSREREPRECIDEIRGQLESHGVRAGISPSFDDYGRVPQAVRLARTALASAPAGAVMYFADGAIRAMAAGAPDVADALTAILLGEVLALPRAERDLLLGTAREWYARAGSVAMTARALFVHPNTVRNRLRRLEELTSRRLSDPRHAAELYLALASVPD